MTPWLAPITPEGLTVHGMLGAGREEERLNQLMGHIKSMQGSCAHVYREGSRSSVNDWLAPITPEGLAGSRKRGLSSWRGTSSTGLCRNGTCWRRRRVTARR